jgi:ribosome biogenesis GTPase A
MDCTTVGFFAGEFMMKRYPEMLMKRYKLDELPDNPTELIEAIGRCLGCLIAGGSIDLHRAAEAFLRELRSGKLGRISFEEPVQSVVETVTPAEPSSE